MTTVSEIITDALQDLNVYGSNDPITDADARKCLRMLNKMLAQWQARKMYVTGQRDVSFAMTGAVSYAIGDGQTVDTPLPGQIDACFYRLNDIDYPVTVLNSYEDYANITLKQIVGTIPNAIFFQRSYPSGAIYVWPQPAVGEIHLITRDIVSQYTSLTDTVTLPPECALAVQFSLEELIARPFGRQVTPDLKLDAKNARDVMKRVNLNIPMMGVPQELLQNGRFSIYTGQ
jgi:hypothetical protein